MALISCPECNREISDQASYCPQCGYPIAKHIKLKNSNMEKYYTVVFNDGTNIVKDTKVKENSKMAMTFCSCITNGGQGYFPTAAAFAEKGYERSTSPFAHDVAQKLIDAALELIDGMELQNEEAE